MYIVVFLARKTFSSNVVTSYIMKNNGAVIFDLNGTIIDDIPYHHSVWCSLLKEGGIEVTEEEFSQRTARTSAAKDIMRMFFGSSPSDEDILELVREKERRYRDMFRPHLQPLAGFRPFIESIRKIGVRTALATSTTLDNASFVLDGLTLRPLFDGIVTVEEVTKPKPDPEIFLKAAHKIGAKPYDCTIFEDSIAGAEAGYSAGMRVVIVKTTLKNSEISTLKGIVRVVDDYTNLTYDKL